MNNGLRRVWATGGAGFPDLDAIVMLQIARAVKGKCPFLLIQFARNLHDFVICNATLLRETTFEMTETRQWRFTFEQFERTVRSLSPERHGAPKVVRSIHGVISEMGSHVPPHLSVATKDKAKEAAKSMSDMIVSQHTRETEMETRLALLDNLILGKNKLILRSISDRIEETVICGVLGISRSEMRAKRIFTLDRLRAYRQRFKDNPHLVDSLHLTGDQVADVELVLGNALNSREVTSGRAHIKRFGDLEAHEDPTVYLPRIDTMISSVFGRDPAKIRAVKAVVNMYEQLQETFPDIED